MEAFANFTEPEGVTQAAPTPVLTPAAPTPVAPTPAAPVAAPAGEQPCFTEGSQGVLLNLSNFD